jgi:hypothetical protein
LLLDSWCYIHRSIAAAVRRHTLHPAIRRAAVAVAVRIAIAAVVLKAAECAVQWQALLLLLRLLQGMVQQILAMLLQQLLLLQERLATAGAGTARISRVSCMRPHIPS